jgi:DNA-binding NarL/FixJ family response regulator
VLSIVIVEDDLLASMALGQLLSNEGFDVRTYASTDLAYPECCVRPPDILIADWSVPGDLSSRQLVDHLHRLNPVLRVIFTSGYEKDEILGRASDEAWMSYVSKPVSFERIIDEIREH